MTIEKKIFITQFKGADDFTVHNNADDAFFKALPEAGKREFRVIGLTLIVSDNDGVAIARAVGMEPFPKWWTTKKAEMVGGVGIEPTTSTV